MNKFTIIRLTKKHFCNLSMLITCSVIFFFYALSSKANTSYPFEHISDITESKQLQKKEIKGIVIDEYNIPIIGANVIEVGTTNGTVTDIDGNFTLIVENDSEILISYMGYLEQTISIANNINFNITLIEDTQALDEVVVIGYGTRSRRDITSAVSNIDSEAINKSIGMSPETAMQGTMSGVHVSGISGDPMSRPTIRIRGTNTWGVSDPLYVIDGIPITEMGAGIEGDDARISDVRGPLNIMTLINPSDIESISVLKDASAAAIYGVRAANGVILITTKKGKLGKPSIDFSSRYGIQNIAKDLNWLSTPEYTRFVQGVFASDPEINPAEENIGRFDPNDPRYLGNSPTYNWQDAAKNNNAITQDYTLSVSGGTENTDYYISLGYSESEGTILRNNLRRYSGSTNINTRINSWIKTGINYRLVNARGQDTWGGQYFDVSRAAPWQPIYSDVNIPGYEGYAYAVGGKQPDGSYQTQKLYGNGTRINSIGRSRLDDSYYDSWRNMGSIYLDLTPIEGLLIRGTVNMDRYITSRYRYEDHDRSAFDYTAGNPYSLTGGKSVGSYGERDIYNNNMVQELMVNYQKSISDHNFDILFNFSNQHYNAKYKTATSEYVTTKKMYLINLGGDNEYTSVGSAQMRWALQGYLYRINYNYASKYYLDATVRRDGSARFAPENRWGTFPSLSGAWRISSEEFMSDFDWMDDLKLRVGWGQLGNQEVRDMAYLSVINKGPKYSVGNVTSRPNYPGSGDLRDGATIFGIPNRSLTWEKTETFNVGFDAQLIRSLTFSAEYYYKTTHGILQEIDIPSSVGVIEAPVANVARVLNKGFEFNLNYNGSIRDFNYSVGANLSTTNNKVLETYKNIPTAGGTVEEGHSIFYHKAYKVAGVFQSDEEANNWISTTEDVNYIKAKVGEGDFYFQDLRGAPTEDGTFYSEGPDGKIDSYDMVNIGKSIPGFFYGVNLNLEWKGVDLSANFSGVGDVMRYNSIKAGTFMPTQGDNVTDIVYNAYTENNKQNVYPRLVFGDPASNLRYSDFFFESGAFFRLQNLQIGYTLPNSLYDYLGNQVSNVRLYLGASNVFTITNYTGYDPENDAYPIPKTVFFGLNIKF